MPCPTRRWKSVTVLEVADEFSANFPCIHPAFQLVEDVPVPYATKCGIVVRVQASSVNPIDWKLQDGLLRPLLPPHLPYVPGKSERMITSGGNLSGHTVSLSFSMRRVWRSSYC